MGERDLDIDLRCARVGLLVWPRSYLRDISDVTNSHSVPGTFTGRRLCAGTQLSSTVHSQGMQSPDPAGRALFNQTTSCASQMGVREDLEHEPTRCMSGPLIAGRQLVFWVYCAGRAKVPQAARFLAATISV
jgi:hypothetical protein